MIAGKRIWVWSALVLALVTAAGLLAVCVVAASHLRAQAALERLLKGEDGVRITGLSLIDGGKNIDFGDAEQLSQLSEAFRSSRPEFRGGRFDRVLVRLSTGDRFPCWIVSDPPSEVIAVNYSEGLQGDSVYHTVRLPKSLAPTLLKWLRQK